MSRPDRLLEDPAVSRMFAALDGNGEELRIVGGAVRNALIGLAPGDIDMATTATPDEVIRRARAAGLKTVPTGIEHGTVTVVVAGRPFEVTTLRRDVETDGRHARVVFGRDWAEDAARRDFTINALSLSADGTVHDTTGGRDDLRDGRVRFIGDPATRIAEDYLRILRFFRFHASYARGAPDAEGFSACIEARAGLARLSRERVGAEMLKLLAAPAPALTVAAMAGAGVIGALALGVPRVARLARFMEIEARLGLGPDPVLRLAALFVAVIEDAERLRERLRLSNAEAARLSLAATFFRATEGPAAPHPSLDERGRRAMLYRLGGDAFRLRALMRWVDHGAADDDAWRDLVGYPDRWTAPKLPWSGADIAALGIAPGPRTGQTLRRLEAAWIAADFPEDGAARDRLLKGSIAGLG